MISILTFLFNISDAFQHVENVNCFCDFSWNRISITIRAMENKTEKVCNEMSMSKGSFNI